MTKLRQFSIWPNKIGLFKEKGEIIEDKLADGRQRRL